MTDFSRRDVLRYAGLAAAATLTAGPAFAANPSPLAFDHQALRHDRTDVLVLGGGMAGVSAALSARASGQRVLLVDKGGVGRSGYSPWAYRMCELVPPDSSREKLLARMLRNSDGLQNLRWLEQLVDQQFRVVTQMKARGWLAVTPWQRAEIWQRQLAEAGIETVERTMVTALIRHADGSMGGAIGFGYDDSRKPAAVTVFNAKVVVNCMGSGGLRSPGFCSWGQTHDGDALSYRAGTMITGKEFTDLDCQYSVPDMLTDARTKAEPAMHITRLTPSSAVASGRQIELSRMLGEPISGVGKPAAETPSSARVPGMGVFCSEGILAVNEMGEARDVPGLYAAGGALASMLTGGGYPYPGLALLAAAVQGDMVGATAGKSAATMQRKTPDSHQIESLVAKLWSSRERKEGYDPRWVGQVLQHHMVPFFVSYWKHADRLQAALSQIDYLRKRCLPHLVAANGHALRLAHELDNQILNQEMRLRASLFRTESRGTHFREDYPAQNDADWRCLVALSQDKTGQMTLAKIPVSG